MAAPPISPRVSRRLIRPLNAVFLSIVSPFINCRDASREKWLVWSSPSDYARARGQHLLTESSSDPDDVMTAVRLQYMLHPVPCPALVTPQLDADQVFALVCRFDVPSHKIVSGTRKFDEAPPNPAQKTGALSSVAEGFGAMLSMEHEDGIFGKPKRIQLVHCQLSRALVLYYTSD
jgi:hypothetical protein